MAQKFTPRPLYGGAITADLPQDVIDASDLRQVPDHQEVFLRPDTLSSIIFEINEYQSPDDAAASGARSQSTAHDASTLDPVALAAASHHLGDTVAPPDTLSPATVSTTQTALKKPSLAPFPAYLTTATIISPEIDKSAAATSTLPVAWQSDPKTKNQQTKVSQLLVRLKKYGTDLCVRINVPLKEFDGPESEGAIRELGHAEEILHHVIESLDIIDSGLFDEEN